MISRLPTSSCTDPAARTASTVRRHRWRVASLCDLRFGRRAPPRFPRQLHVLEGARSLTEQRGARAGSLSSGDCLFLLAIDRRNVSRRHLWAGYSWSQRVVADLLLLPGARTIDRTSALTLGLDAYGATPRDPRPVIRGGRHARSILFRRAPTQTQGTRAPSTQSGPAHGPTWSPPGSEDGSSSSPSRATSRRSRPSTTPTDPFGGRDSGDIFDAHDDCLVSPARALSVDATRGCRNRQWGGTC